MATSLGYGVLQVNAGLNHLFPHIPIGTHTQIILIIAITALATLSVVSGLDKGIKLLSEFNLGLAVLLMLFVLFDAVAAEWFDRFAATQNRLHKTARMRPIKY